MLAANANQRKWEVKSAAEIKVFIDVSVYMGIYRSPSIREYWNTDSKSGLLHKPVSDNMGKTRYEQLRRFLHVGDPTKSTNELKKSTFGARDAVKPDNDADEEELV